MNSSTDLGYNTAAADDRRERFYEFEAKALPCREVVFPFWSSQYIEALTMTLQSEFVGFEVPRNAGLSLAHVHRRILREEKTRPKRRSQTILSGPIEVVFASKFADRILEMSADFGSAEFLAPDYRNQVNED